ncbi:hypothetical protein [Caballeronia sp. AZ7_KS35]|uniref:hypothetical protein n=1 Tax=Caballeronia sp. AZ7_KS35 TaxID=2921762 RepID=UPI002028F57D|nr:hypothetical protein [Caballeronia sp. AZ7_KS35]
MEKSHPDRRMFFALLSIGLVGLLLVVGGNAGPASTLSDAAASGCGDLLLFFGGIGGTGLLCTVILGPAGVERAHFWIFLAALVGAALFFTFGNRG